MIPKDVIQNIGLSEYAIKAYVSLVAEHPVNGSQLSRNSGIPRARIYDVLRTLASKGYVTESSEGKYTPLPPDEFIRRLKRNHESSLALLERLLAEAQQQSPHDWVWALHGYDNVILKAKEMIAGATKEIYARMYPAEGRHLNAELAEAESRGVEIKYISMIPCELSFQVQVTHPHIDDLESILGGRSFDLVVDREEIIGGLFEKDQEDDSPIYWGKNRWFVWAVRDSLRHDFYHCFLHKILDQRLSLSPREEKIYQLISSDY